MPLPKIAAALGSFALGKGVVDDKNLTDCGLQFVSEPRKVRQLKLEPGR